MPAPGPTLEELAARHGAALVPGAATGVVRVDGVCHDSRRVGPGQLYAALPGHTVHGAHFTVDALRAGSVAVLTDAHGAEQVRDTCRAAGLGNPPVLVHQDPRAALGPVAAELEGHPSQSMAVVGVTGTNGKTTVSFLVEELLRDLGLSTGLIGTVGSRVGEQLLPSSFTTPEAPDLQHLLARMRDAGCAAVTAEVSSHALAQRRVDATRFALAVFTNLSQDHLDFHGTLAAYFAAKLRLLTGGFADTAVVGVDDRWGRAAAQAASEAGLQVLGVSVDGSEDDEHVDVVVRVLGTHPDGSQDIRMTGPFGPGGLHGERVGFDARLRMPGAFNAVNAATAVASVHTLLRTGAVEPAEPVEPARLAAALGRCRGVPGRMERVVVPGAPLVVVDYAHTPDAVGNAVRALRASTRGRLVVVLGAGGDRDRGKRAAMGAATAEADLVVVTDDNPRSEDPAAIRAAVLSGVTTACLEVPDRAEAIRVAVRESRGAGGVVLLAGKGHETGQTLATGTVAFDDRDQARRALVELAGADA